MIVLSKLPKQMHTFGLDKNGVSARILTSGTYSLVDQPLEWDGCEKYKEEGGCFSAIAENSNGLLDSRALFFCQRLYQNWKMRDRSGYPTEKFPPLFDSGFYRGRIWQQIQTFKFKRPSSTFCQWGAYPLIIFIDTTTIASFDRVLHLSKISSQISQERRKE